MCNKNFIHVWNNDTNVVNQRLQTHVQEAIMITQRYVWNDLPPWRTWLYLPSPQERFHSPVKKEWKQNQFKTQIKPYTNSTSWFSLFRMPQAVPLSRKYRLTNFFAKQKPSRAPLTTTYYDVIMTGNLFLLSNTFLCSASFRAYRVYEIGQRSCPEHFPLFKLVSTRSVTP